MNKITVLISDDHAIIRDGLRCLLERTEDLLVVGEAENGQESVRKTKSLLPDVVLLDLEMPLLNGIEAARQIGKAVPCARLLVLSAFSDDQHVQDAIQAGVAGYLIKETVVRDLLMAVREVHRGNAFFSDCINRSLLRHVRNILSNAPSKRARIKLTIRESEVLQLIAEGYATKQIAGVLSLSVKTIQKHRQTLMDRLNLHNIPNLTRYAVAHGVVPPQLNWPIRNRR